MKLWLIIFTFATAIPGNGISRMIELDRLASTPITHEVERFTEGYPPIRQARPRQPIRRSTVPEMTFGKGSDLNTPKQLKTSKPTVSKKARKTSKPKVSSNAADTSNSL